MGAKVGHDFVKETIWLRTKSGERKGLSHQAGPESGEWQHWGHPIMLKNGGGFGKLSATE